VRDNTLGLNPTAECKTAARITQQTVI
jgi:hypothetical protein